MCRAHDMVHAQRRQLAASPDKHGCSLCIISWNVQLLWPQAGAMPLRAACIAERLLALNADIVCLQVRCALRRFMLSLSKSHQSLPSSALLSQ